MTFVNNTSGIELQNVERRIQEIIQAIHSDGLPNEQVVQELRRIIIDFKKIEIPKNI